MTALSILWFPGDPKLIVFINIVFINIMFLSITGSGILATAVFHAMF